MVKFKGHGVIWDAAQGKALCEFKGGSLHKKGTFETEDVEVAKKLVDLGYEYEGEFPSEEKKPEGDQGEGQGEDFQENDDSNDPENTEKVKGTKGAKKG